MPNFSRDKPENGTNQDGAKADEKPSRTRGLLPQALEELQSSVEELRVADEEMRVQNEELLRGRLRLEAERQRYQDLFEFAPDGYLVTDMEGVILEANRAVSKMLNISPRFLKKRGLGTLVVLPDLAEFQTRLKDLANPGANTTAEMTVRLRRRPAGQFPAAVTAARYHGLPGEPPTLRWLLRDITERIEAEEARAALARAEAQRAEAEEVGRRTQEILERITDIHVALDTEWRIVSLNASALRLVQSAGLDPASVIGQVLWEVDPTENGREFEEETMRAVADGRMVEFEAFSRAAGGWFQVRVFPQPGGVALYSTDITERKEAEAALQAGYARERRIAETLQEILLHTPPAEVSPALTIEAIYEAASNEAAVGGDFSDVFTYDGGEIVLVVGDISGKGLKAATLIAEVKYALRAIFREHPWPETALRRLNDFVCEAQRQGDFGGDYQVVLSLAVFDPKTGRLTYVTAGGEPLLLVRESGGAEAVGVSGLLLGVQPGETYTAAEAQLASGDTALLATDGLTEARRGKEVFGFDGLQVQAAASLPGRPLREAGQALIESVRGWAGGTFQDDVCILLARRS